MAVNALDPDSAAKTVALVKENRGRAVAELGRVDEPGVGDALVRRAIAEFGRLGVVVANAGVLRDRVLWKMSDEDFDDVISTHLRGTFLSVRPAVQRFHEQGHGGSVILIGSPAGQLGNFGQGTYSAAKAGTVAMARTWALECARDSITVNAIVPTAFTRMAAAIPACAELTARVLTDEPVPRRIRSQHGLGTVEDVASLVVFLASEAAGGISGQAIGIGGTSCPSGRTRPRRLRYTVSTAGVPTTSLDSGR